jgi:hypothetical protein
MMDVDKLYVKASPQSQIIFPVYAAHHSSMKNTISFSMSSKMIRLLPTVVVSAAAVCMPWQVSAGAVVAPRSIHYAQTRPAATDHTHYRSAQPIGIESAKRLALAGSNVIITARSDAGQAAVKELLSSML